MAKVAIKKETEAFITWALQENNRINAGAVQRFIERVTGRDPISPASAPKPRRGPLARGEKIIVDKYRNTNSLAGMTGVTVKFENGDVVFFEGNKPGKATGLYRWTPKADYQDGAVTKHTLIEMVYLRGGTAAPPQRDIDALKQYVERGMARGEHRSDIYYTGYVGKFAYNKSGQVYFVLSSQQRDRPTSINPSKGKMLYIGFAGKRPGGWKADAQSMGIVV
jgi:hypothetical protein